MHFGLWRAYSSWNPDEVLARLAPEEQRDTLAYGETPAVSVLKMLALCHTHFPHAQSLLDLGAGRGIVAMTAAANGWDAVALEYLQEFITRSEPLTQRLAWPVYWLKGDFLTLTLPQSDIIHVAATAYPQTTRDLLGQRLAEQCQDHQGILTQDWILDDQYFEALAGFRLPVTWGSSYVTLHRRRPI